MTTPIFARPADILADLIRFDTTNPPGNEIECIGYIRDLLSAAGFDTALFAKTPSRPNLVTRLAGRGDAPPFLWQGHVDVVTTANQPWTRDPFAAELVDGELWGRGALDMKGGVAMMLAALLRAKAEGFRPAGDIILCVLADEEAGSDYGARFMVEEHAEQFEGVRYAIGEGGGSAQSILGQRFYPIMVAEKQVCWMTATLHGAGGHGSMPLRDGAMARLGRLLTTLNSSRLPVHLTPAVQAMIEAIAAAMPIDVSPRLRGLLDPAQTDAILDELAAEGVGMGRMLDALTHNTVNATVVHASDKTNVIPTLIRVELDGRLLPGYHAEQMLDEVRTLARTDPALADVEFALLRHDPVDVTPDLTLFPLLADLLREADPDATPIPSVVGGFTDGRMFARLGIQNYGFLPQNLPASYSGLSLVHGADERVPVETLTFGTDVLSRLLERYTVD